jgi:flagellar secretion chaperone FliS
MHQTDLAYRQSAAVGANGFGILLALYDTLVGNLRRAAVAQRAGALELRAKELKHAFVVVGFLENWVDPEGGALASRMIAFYSTLRRKMIEAQARQSAEILEEQMAATLNMREVWQGLELQAAPSGPEILPPARTEGYGGFQHPQLEREQASWSA